MNPPVLLRRLFVWGLAFPLSLLAEDAPAARATVTSPPVPVPQVVKRTVRLRTNQVFATSGALTPGAAAPVLTLPRSTTVPPPAIAYVSNPDALAWDSKVKQYDAKAGETEAKFTFALTNVSKENVTINSVHTSCGCTAAKLPQQPWLLVPGDHGEIGVTVDLRGKFGTVTKTATIASSVGQIPLTVRISIPQPDATASRMGNRSRNLQVAAADRQAVFRNDCASCHVAPALGKTGKALYETACGVCHEGEHRASMVPDLHALTKPTDHAYWTQWITSGREGSLMPAFALKQGGILSDDQITSLADYLDSDFHLEVKLPGTSLTPPPSNTLQPVPLAK